MGTHLRKEIDALKKKILSLGAIVEESVIKAVKSFQDRDIILAKSVINNDLKIDSREVSIEEECLKVLALHQPVAIDLRLLISFLKINSDLERIGDLAVNIAERTLVVSGKYSQIIRFNITHMSDKTQVMLKKSLDALVNLDSDLAREVCSKDDEVDIVDSEIYNRVSGALDRRPQSLVALIHLLLVSRSLERIADHATNIAEDVIYMIEGEIVRHKPYKLSSA